MTFAHRLLTVAACVLSAQAVNIMLYTSDDCSGTADVTCTNIGVNSCCVAGGSDESALFNGLPTEGVPAQGLVFTGNGGPCTGTACNSGFGLNLCLSCDNRYLNGANWILPNGSKKRDDCQPVLPDRAHIAGHTFAINYDVPANVSDAIMDFVRMHGDAKSEDLPRFFFNYEVDEE